MAQLRVVPALPTTIWCRFHGCQQDLTWTRRIWAQLLSSCNTQLIYFGRFLNRKRRVRNMALIEKKRAILIFIFQKLLGGTIRASNFARRSLIISSVSVLCDYTNEEIPNYVYCALHNLCS